MVCFSPNGDSEDKKNASVRDKQTETEKKREEEEEAEEGIDTANDFMKKFLKKAEG
jgi:hypothetical protein